jgi:hypothetical protein
MLKTLIFSFWFIFHPVHVSVTSIEYVQEKSKFSVFMKMYFSDFLIDYKLSGGDTQKTGFTVIDKKAFKEMENYLEKRFSLISDNVDLIRKVYDINVEGDDLNVKFDLSVKRKPGNIVVNSKIMTGIYADQTNLIIMKVNDFEEGIKLNSEITEHSFLIK